MLVGHDARADAGRCGFVHGNPSIDTRTGGELLVTYAAFGRSGIRPKDVCTIHADGSSGLLSTGLSANCFSIKIRAGRCINACLSSSQLIQVVLQGCRHSEFALRNTTRLRNNT
jgi:hypothetical protein